MFKRGVVVILFFMAFSFEVNAQSTVLPENVYVENMLVSYPQNIYIENAAHIEPGIELETEITDDGEEVASPLNSGESAAFENLNNIKDGEVEDFSSDVKNGPEIIKPMEKKTETIKPVEFFLTPIQALAIAKKLFSEKVYSDAKLLLQSISFKELDYEIERLFIIGQIDMIEKNWEGAIEVFSKILEINPKIARVRLDLALAYLQNGSFYKADYNLRLALAEPLPQEVIYNVQRFLYMLRSNKNWNVWFSLGVAPDTNINNGRRGTQCISTVWGVLCNQLPGAEKAIGYNVSFGGNHEWRLSEQFRIKTDAAVIISKYEDDSYDDFMLTGSVGPRYVFSNGDVWLAATSARRWLAHSPYSSYIGAKLAVDYDITKQLSSYWSARWNPMKYDEFDSLNGDSWGVASAFTYSLSSSKYIRFGAGYDRESTAHDWYKNTKKNVYLGFGFELPYGFSMYLSPSIVWTDYDNERPYVVGNAYENVLRKDEQYKYTLTLFNKKLNFWGFAPTFSYSYIDKNSNVWQQEYTKHVFDVGITQRF